MIYESHLINAIRILKTPNIGPVTYSVLKKKYKNLNDIIHHLEKQNINVISIEEAQKEIDNHKKFNSQLLEIDMDNYPKKLKKYINFPLISIKGNINILNNPTIAIVGARQGSLIGKEFTKILTKKIRDNYTTVSGLAIGIDTIVAENSINNHIGVMPGGINKFYPPSSHNLHEILSTNGNSCLISCQPFDTDPKKNLFPLRNQLIAALSDGIIITEAQIKSGSLQTAQWALNYGKPLLVVPGHPLDLNYSGNNYLLKNPQVIPFYDTIILEDIFQKNIGQNNNHVEDSNELDLFSPTIDMESLNVNLQKEILSMITITPLSINHLSHYLNYSIGEVLSNCIFLELQGQLIINDNMTVNKTIDHYFYEDDL